jgi:hypothetical protein
MYGTNVVSNHILHLHRKYANDPSGGVWFLCQWSGSTGFDAVLLLLGTCILAFAVRLVFGFASEESETEPASETLRTLGVGVEEGDRESDEADEEISPS